MHRISTQHKQRHPQQAIEARTRLLAQVLTSLGKSIGSGAAISAVRRREKASCDPATPSAHSSEVAQVLGTTSPCLCGRSGAYVG